MTLNFRDPHFLLRHIQQTLAFYHPRCIDPDGGFFHYFRDNGEIYNTAHRHLVSSTRFVFNYAMAYQTFGDPAYRYATLHGIRYLREYHLDPRSGSYTWTLRDHQPEDQTRHAYGMAFVLLAYASALKAGLQEVRPWLDETWNTLETYFWDLDYGLYRDESDTCWNFSAYRGQNSNMHLCEGLIAAFEATQNQRYLQRALHLADRVTNRLAALSHGMVWEHYDRRWQVDWGYNLENPKHLFRPWGFQPGHQSEWAKLLLILDRHVQEDWLVSNAIRLFDTVVIHAWDGVRDGLVYGLSPDHSVCDGDKYFWVHSESIAAAALLAKRTGNVRYWQWYDRIWSYCWTNLVDHEHGAWYRIVDRNNQKISDEKSPAGKTDYHTMGACYEVIRALKA